MFHETIFPFHSLPVVDDLVDPFPTLVLPKSSLDIPPSPNIPSTASGHPASDISTSDSAQDTT